MFDVCKREESRKKILNLGEKRQNFTENQQNQNFVFLYLRNTYVVPCLIAAVLLA